MKNFTIFPRKDPGPLLEERLRKGRSPGEGGRGEGKGRGGKVWGREERYGKGTLAPTREGRNPQFSNKIDATAYVYTYTSLFSNTSLEKRKTLSLHYIDEFENIQSRNESRKVMSVTLVAF